MREAGKYLQGFLKIMRENTQSIEAKLDVFDSEPSFRLNQKYTKSRQRSPDIQEYSHTTSKLDDEVNVGFSNKNDKSFNKLKSYGNLYYTYIYLELRKK